MYGISTFDKKNVGLSPSESDTVDSLSRKTAYMWLQKHLISDSATLEVQLINVLVHGH